MIDPRLRPTVLTGQEFQGKVLPLSFVVGKCIARPCWCGANTSDSLYRLLSDSYLYGIVYNIRASLHMVYGSIWSYLQKRCLSRFRKEALHSYGSKPAALDLDHPHSAILTGRVHLDPTVQMAAVDPPL